MLLFQGRRDTTPLAWDAWGMEWNVSAGFEAKDGRHQTSGSGGVFLGLLCKQMQFLLQLFSKDVVSNSLAG